MSDAINIDTVEKFLQTELDSEMSDISTIIKSMISIKRNRSHITCKKSQPYSILDKIALNELSKNISIMIKKYHDDNFDIVEEVLESLDEYDACIRKDLYDYYWDRYIKIIIKLDIEYDDQKALKAKSSEIYTLLTKKVISDTFDGKKTDIPSNKIETYVEAITAYVFYRCKFLIPIEGAS